MTATTATPTSREPACGRCGRFERGRAFDPARHCRLCWLAAHDRAYNLLFGGDGRVADVNDTGGVAAGRRPPCRHLGARLADVPVPCGCGNDPNNVRMVPLYGCAVHGSTGGLWPVPILDEGRRKTGYYPSCFKCLDYEASPDAAGAVLPYGNAPIVRHLLFHVWPRKDAAGQFWRWHVGQLKRRMGVFNGRRVVAVVTGEDTDTLAEVQEAFGDDVTEYIVRENVPELREALTAPALWGRVESTAPNEMVFYCQGKGVRGQNDAIRLWCEIMYAACLDYLPLVERLLLTYGTAGVFKHVGDAWPGCPWHYSGSSYWCRSARLFSRPWRQSIPHAWYGVEAFPGIAFKYDEAACLFDERPLRANVAWNYIEEHMRDVIGPAWERWKAEHVGERTEGVPCP